MLRDVKIKTAAQEITIKAPEILTLEEVLRINRIPTNLFQGYLKERTSVTPKPIPLNIRLNDLSGGAEIILQCIRNTDLRQVLPQKVFYKKVDNPIIALHDFNIGSQECTETIHELNVDSAKEIVENKVSEFISKYSKENKIIAGISGGGDSNTLVRSLRRASPDKELICFTLVFEPIWPVSAAKRAEELCKENSVSHLIYTSQDIEKLLQMKGNLQEFYGEFRQNFGENTVHFFATYLISLIARKLCREYNTSEYYLGFNREDVFAELLFSLINGHKPLAYPVRQFGKIQLLMPLCEIPKRVLDACYPKYSLDNYRERVDITTAQRSIIYFLAHSIEDAYDNLGLSIMWGVRKLFEKNWSKLKPDENWDLYISEYAEPNNIAETKELLQKYFHFPIRSNYDT